MHSYSKKVYLKDLKEAQEFVDLEMVNNVHKNNLDWYSWSRVTHSLVNFTRVTMSGMVCRLQTH